jgi:hypothetical protein
MTSSELMSDHGTRGRLRFQSQQSVDGRILTATVNFTSDAVTFMRRLSKSDSIIFEHLRVHLLYSRITGDKQRSKLTVVATRYVWFTELTRSQLSTRPLIRPLSHAVCFATTAKNEHAS